MPTKVRWDPAQHPRGPLGRFIDVGDRSGPGWGPSSSFRSFSEAPKDQEVIGRRLPPKYPDAERRALEIYQADYGDRTNRDLRAGMDPSGKRGGIVPLMDRAIEREQLAQDTRVYRGLAPSDTADWSSLKEGDQIVDRGFLSTTLDEDMPFNFDAYEGAYLEIELPKGTHVALPPDRDEREVLLGRGTVLEITEVVNEQADVHLVARLVGYVED